ncbi:hypothetical protein F7734_00340 [Scytonema sp. UIC 10036]|uniref:hypothetical protein n=1 Tax=Scytonema sp. UIC 10036 TaxID=2304196 RepID=UPI0012DA75D3|nr:hypothetical protein [Scytonema sp. UIC 10036]MUG91032.1 hypothetical protein [Scytonema sp. UIC 10036]
MYQFTVACRAIARTEQTNLSAIAINAVTKISRIAEFTTIPLPIVKRGGGSEVKLKNARSLVRQRDFDEGVCQLWVENRNGRAIANSEGVCQLWVENRNGRANIGGEEGV